MLLNILAILDVMTLSQLSLNIFAVTIYIVTNCPFCRSECGRSRDHKDLVYICSLILYFKKKIVYTTRTCDLRKT